MTTMTFLSNDRLQPEYNTSAIYLADVMTNPITSIVTPLLEGVGMIGGGASRWQQANALTFNASADTSRVSCLPQYDWTTQEDSDAALATSASAASIVGCCDIYWAETHRETAL